MTSHLTRWGHTHTCSVTSFSQSSTIFYGLYVIMKDRKTSTELEIKRNFNLGYICGNFKGSLQIYFAKYVLLTLTYYLR